MKNYILPLLGAAMLVTPAISAKDLSGVKIYVNPGHGGYNMTQEKNDRNIPTIPFEALDKNGFWESSCNLTKGLELERLLKNSGATVMLSRTQNRDEDDKDLSEISEEANVFGADAFISIHSNALGTNNGTNYLLCLYKGIEGGEKNAAAKPEDKKMAEQAWKYLFDNNMTVWTGGFTPENPCIRDDFHFLGYYLAVMKNLTVPGFLVEGSFHDYEPETHRLLNDDYAKLTATALHRFFCDYFGAEKTGKGVIAGTVKDSQRVMTHQRFNNFVRNTHDQYQPINGATVALTDQSGHQVATYTTDNFYNGVFVFSNLAPGNYKVKMSAEGYISQEKEVTVTADQTTSFYTLLEDPNYIPPAKIPGKANVYASELSAKKVAEGQYDLGFKLNTDAENVEVRVYKGDVMVKNFVLGAKAKGSNEVTVDLTGVDGTGLQWSIVASAAPTVAEQPLRFTDSDETVRQFNEARGRAVDNNMDSPYFGRIYVTESKGGAVGGGRTTTDGIFILDPTFTDVTSQGANGYAGGQNWGATSSPMRLAIADDGKVFVCDWSDSHSGVWYMDPANPTGNFKSVFAEGSRAGSGLMSVGGANVHGSISSCYVTGKGEETTLYTFDEDYEGEGVVNKMVILQYNIGTMANPWATAPSAVAFGNADKFQQNGNSVIVPDGRGGWWISQYRFSDSVVIPALIHANASGEVDYNSGKTGVIGTSQRAGLAVSTDGKLMAVGCGDEIKVFELNYGAEAPELVLKHSIAPVLGTESYGLAFDVANNVYLASGTGKGIGAWALPKEENMFETLAPASMTLDGTMGSVDGVVSHNAVVMFDGDILTVQSDSELGRLSVFNVGGLEMFNQEVKSSEFELNVSNWAKGVYIVRVNHQTYKIIK